MASSDSSLYVLITPAHNEESFIEHTIRSVIGQTVRPSRWVIVNDGSTDRTAGIVSRHASDHKFIALVNLERAEGRNFAKKANAFSHGLATVKDIPYAYIGNLDADISLAPDYHENLLFEFAKDPRLGIAGGIVFTRIGDQFATQDETLDSVGGAVQLFRRDCFEQIGGYLPLPYGGIDAAAEITARMKGWTVRKFPDNPVWEYRRTGTATARPLFSRVTEGRRFYSLGYGVVFYLLRCVYRMKDPPYVLGSAAALAGYLYSMVRREPTVLSEEAVRYLRAEQWKKLCRFPQLWKRLHSQ